MTLARREVIVIDSSDPAERGAQRARALGSDLAKSLAGYLELFAAVGLAETSIREGAERTLDATLRWHPELVAEMGGLADAAGIPLWQIGALNARTEILSGALGTKPGECSTIVGTTRSPIGVQTWDWHEELDPFWHLHRVRGTPRGFVGLTEMGILSKVGMNDAGVGIFLNILGHTADRADGVPVHLVGARVLAEAGDLAQAVRILESAPVSTSSAITVIAPEGAVTVELSPVGAAVIRPTDGVLLHTNHFVEPRLSAGEKVGVYDPDSQLRYAVLTDRVALEPLPQEAQALIPYLFSYPGDEAELCCVPAEGAVLGQRWATLATVVMDSATRSMSVSPGSPLEVSPQSLVRLTPAPETPQS